jgi:uncharacterized membrane protein
MMSFTHPLLLLLALPLLAITLLAQRNAFANLTRKRMRLSLAVRLVILAALVLSLAGTHLRLAQSHQAAVFVADLSASDAGLRSAVQAAINGAATRRPGGDSMGIVSVGRQPVVEQPVGGMTGFSGFQSTVDPQYTNLAGGLDLANALLPGGFQRRIVVMSDGRQNVGDALSTARLLRSQGVRLDVLPLRVPVGPEVLVDSVSVPAELRPRETFPLTVTVRSTVQTVTGLTMLRGRTVIGSTQETVHPGANKFIFQQSPLRPGSYTYAVEITPARDTQPENNAGSAYTTVQGTPRVLVIASDPREAVNVMGSLKSTGIAADLKQPGSVTPDLAVLQRYAAVVIVDTSADDLGARLMDQLVPYVRDLGHGLVVIGGQNAYSMGGYGHTPLEQALPVSMDLPKHQKQPTVAVALIIESLEEDTQVNISKEAGKSLVNLLGPQDLVAVNDAPFDGSAGWVVPMQHVANRAGINGAIDRMVPGDPDSYSPMLQSAYDALRHTNARIKHIILLGDGDAEDPSYQQLVQTIHAGGVTVSTVSTNGLGRFDYQNMENIARWGGGRYYIANDTARIPQIFLREARTVARLGIVQGKFFPQELSANPMVRDLRQVAPLYGYVATSPKPAAEIVLASGKLDPVLAAWQYGLGRSVAWTSDAAGLWSRDWLRAPGASRFWADLTGWVLPATGTGKLFITAGSSQGQGHVAVNVPSALGPDPAVTAHVLTPGLQTATIQLQPSSPGQFAGSFQETGQGAYFITVDAHGAGHGEAGQVGMTVPYSPEYRNTGLDMSFMQSLAAAGGGSVITRPADAWKDNLPSVMQEYDISLWLLLPVLLLPVDVGLRRLVVSRRELATILEAVPLRRRASPDGQSASPLIGAVRQRRLQRELVTQEAASTAPRAATVAPAAQPAARQRSASRPVTRTATAAGAAGGEERRDQPDEQSLAGRILAARRRKE